MSEIIPTQEARECADKEINNWYQSGIPTSVKVGSFVQRLVDHQVNFSCQNWKHRDARLRGLLSEARFLIERIGTTAIDDSDVIYKRDKWMKDFGDLKLDSATALIAVKGEK